MLFLATMQKKDIQVLQGIFAFSMALQLTFLQFKSTDQDEQIEDHFPSHFPIFQIFFLWQLPHDLRGLAMQQQGNHKSPNTTASDKEAENRTTETASSYPVPL